MSISSQVRILLISPSEISQDPRVLAHLDVLKEYGDVVTAGYGDTPHGVNRHVSIESKARYLPMSFLGLLQVLVGLNILAGRRTKFSQSVLKATMSDVYDLVVANDVHALCVAHEVSKRTKAALWVDMHEYAPLEGEDDWRWMLIFRRYVTAICNKYLKQADCVTTVGEAIRRKYEEESEREVLLLRNTSEFQPRHAKPQNNGLSDFALIHVGVAIRARRLENMIEAVKDLDGVSLDLLVLPTDTTYFREIEKRVAGSTNVRILAPVPSTEISQFISKYDCGIVTIPPTSFNYANGLPNKLFQYIQARLPIITGPIPEVAYIVNHYGIGWVTNDFSSNEIRLTIETARNVDKTRMEQHLDKAASELSREKENQIRRMIISNLLSV